MQTTAPLVCAIITILISGVTATWSLTAVKVMIVDGDAFTALMRTFALYLLAKTSASY